MRNQNFVAAWSQKLPESRQAQIRSLYTPAFPANFKPTLRRELDVLGITLRNLIENAVRYGVPDEPIEIVVERGRQIRLLNGGAPIRAETLETLKKPFVRGSSVGAGGGLGLAIVDSVMKQIGCSLTLISPAMGRGNGFEARLVFPEPGRLVEASDQLTVTTTFPLARPLST
jgi:signal transduction histidine kinase